MSKEQLNELQKLAEPIVEYLRKNFHPHTVIMITDERVDVFEGVAGVPFCVSD